MSKIDTIISELQAIASNPRKAMNDYKAETGKGAVGIAPVYAPEELVYAAGRLPIGCWGGQTEISNARAYLPPFACSIMQSVMELECNGVYNDLEAVIFSAPCDTLKCMGQKWKGTCPCIQFVHPQNVIVEGSTKFLATEYAIVKEKLEGIFGEKITDEAIEKAIVVYNEHRATMREFCKVAADYPQVIDPIKRHAVIKAGFFMDKAKHTAAVKELIAELKATPVQPWDGKKVVLTGILAEPNELLQVLIDNKIAVVADDLAQESRQFRADVPAEGGDVLTRLAMQWTKNMYGCSLLTDRDKSRSDMLVNMVKETGADAVIIMMMKFCDPEEFDYPMYFQKLNAAGIKSLKLEIDQQTTSFEQAATRVQALVETL
ncbi:MAG: 2-hydroxyacyl-CoA dehydratase family protein [Clostridia bacterium]|nr:2-hydroxyacyl-CoA dehydratase family protein [Clostridia bacterium]